MKKILTLFILITVSCWLMQRANAQDFGIINGTWEGKLKFVYNSNMLRDTVSLKSEYNGPIRIVINNETVKVFNGIDNIEVKPGSFHIVRHMTNILIYAINDANEDGGWVDSWVFIMTQQDINTLIVDFCRMINNRKVPLTEKISKLSYFRTGLLKKVTE